MCVYACVKCGAIWDTEWLADNCADCLPYECDRCGRLYPDREASYLCCRD